MPGRLRSSVYFARPEALAKASILRGLRPMCLNRRDMKSPFHFPSGQPDSRKNPVVAGAPAEVARNSLLDAVLPPGAAMPFLLEMGLGREYHPRRAVAALDRSRIGEGLNEGMVLADAFDRRDRTSLHPRRQSEARADRPAVQQDGAGPALARLAAVLGAGKSHILAKHLEQSAVRLDLEAAALAV